MQLNLVDIVQELNNEVYESSLESCNKTWKKPSLKMKNHSDSIKVYNWPPGDRQNGGNGHIFFPE